MLTAPAGAWYGLPGSRRPCPISAGPLRMPWASDSSASFWTLRSMRQPHVVALHRAAAAPRTPSTRPLGVDLQLGDAGLAAEGVLVGRLDAGLADLVARLVALLLALRQLLVGDLADVADDVGRHVPERPRHVGPLGLGGGVDARILVLMLLDVDDLAAVDVLGDRDRTIRAVARVGDVALEAGLGDAEQGGQPAEDGRDPASPSPGRASPPRRSGW